MSIHQVKGILTINAYEDQENKDININYLEYGNYDVAIESVSDVFEDEIQELDEGLYEFSFTEKYYSYQTACGLEHDCKILDKDIKLLNKEVDLFKIIKAYKGGVK